MAKNGPSLESCMSYNQDASTVRSTIYFLWGLLNSWGKFKYEWKDEDRLFL